MRGGRSESEERGGKEPDTRQMENRIVRFEESPEGTKEKKVQTDLEQNGGSEGPVRSTNQSRGGGKGDKGG